MKYSNIGVEFKDPVKTIKKLLEDSGAKNVNVNSTFNGGRFEYRLEDIVDEREFKKKMIEILRKNGFRAN